MKLLMTADAVGGVWTYALELCAALAAREVQIVLAVLGPQPSPAQRADAARIACVKLVHAPCKLEWMDNPWRDVDRTREWLLDLAGNEGADVVHLNGYCHADACWNRPVVVVAHSCVCSWWRAVHGRSPPAAWETYRRNVSAGLAAASHVVAPTHAFRRTLAACHGLATPASVIHNGRSAAPFAGRADDAREPFVFACGRLWDEAKNMSALDAAARGVPWPIRVAGDATAPDGARFDCSRLETLGALSASELADELSRASIYVHPAVYEPFGLSALEAAHAGCALLLADLASLRELWEGAALFAPPDDPHELRARLVALIEDPRLRRRLARAATERASRFAPEVMGRRYFDLYCSLLARERAPSSAPRH